MADVQRFYDRFAPIVSDVFRPLLRDYADLIKSAIADELGSDIQPDARYDRFVQDYLENLARRYVLKSRKQIDAIVRDVPPEEQAEAVDGLVQRWEEDRPARVARSETVRAMGALSKAAYASAGIMLLVWRTVGDNCPYCNKLRGKVVGINESFAAKGDTINPDSEDHAPMTVRATIGHPPAHAGCDCLVGAGDFMRHTQPEEVRDEPGRQIVMPPTMPPVTVNVTVPPNASPKAKRLRFTRTEDGTVEAIEEEDAD